MTTSLFDNLPNYIECEGCQQRHFLTIHKTLNGSWSAAYVEFTDNTAILSINNADDLNEVAIRMQAKMRRFLRG